MPELQTIFAVALAGLVLSVTPGPSMFYVLSRSIGQSRSAGFASAIGLGLGGVVLAAATALGLAAVFATFDWMVFALRIIGSAYLIFLGVGMIRDARTPSLSAPNMTKVERRSFSRIVWQGVWVELLNPKTVLFFALFLPPFVDAGAQGSVQSQLLILGVLVPLVALPSDLVVAWMGGTMSEAMTRQTGLREALCWIGGITLIFIALNLHLDLI